MPQTMLPSTLGNIVANRQRLSAIRQRVGLESLEQQQGPGQMQAAAPQPPGKPAMSQTNPGQVAMTGNPTMNKAQDPSLANPASGNMATTFKFDDATRAALLPKITAFLDQHGPQQQAMADQERQQAQQQQPSQQVDASAMAPLTTFMRQNGRTPTPQEWQQLKSQQRQRPMTAPLPGAGAMAQAQQPPAFKDGGGFMAPERIHFVGDSGKIYGVAGEAGKKERVTITPTNQPQGRVPATPRYYQDGGDMSVDPNADQLPGSQDDPQQDDPTDPTDPSSPSYDPSQDPNNADQQQQQQPDETAPLPPQAQQYAPPPSGNFGGKPSLSPAQARQAVIQHATQWTAQNGGGDPQGEIEAELGGLDGWMRGENVAPEWMSLLDEVPGLADLRSSNTGFKVAGGLGQSFGASSPARGTKGKPGAAAPGGPVHFGPGQPGPGVTQEGAQAATKPGKATIGSVQDYIAQKGQMPSLDELYSLGVTQALGGPTKATPQEIFKWRNDHLTGTDKQYVSKFGQLPTLKQSVNFEAETVLNKTLGRAPTAAEKYNYLSAHADTDTDLSNLSSGGGIPSPDTLRKLEMAQVVSTMTPPKGKAQPDYEKLVSAKALADAQRAHPDNQDGIWQKSVDVALNGLHDYQAGKPVDPEWIKEYHTVVKPGVGTNVKPNLVTRYQDESPTRTGGPQGTSIEDHLNR